METQNSIVIENQWTSWESVRGVCPSNSDAARIAVLRAGGTIKRRLGLRSDPFVFRLSRGGLEFQASGVAGTISLSEANFEVVPKFAFTPERARAWNASALFLLDALNGKHVIPMLAERQHWERHRVIDLIAHAFADAAEKGLRDQAIMLYRQIEEASVALRGRLNIGRQVRNLARSPHLLECDVDQLDVENMFNDVLKWAATSLSILSRERALKNRLASIAQAIPGDVDRSFGYRHLRLRPPPQFREWSDALQLARLLANGMTSSEYGGNSSGYSLMFNMEKAFERFVEVALSRSLANLSDAKFATSHQGSLVYAEPVSKGARQLRCRPDNLVWRDGVPAVVVDAKYKLLDRELDPKGTASPKSQDIYELLTGMSAFNCRSGLLLYPDSTAGVERPSMRTWKLDIYGKEVQIGALPIDFSGLQSRSHLLRLIELVSEQVAAFVGSGVTDTAPAG